MISDLSQPNILQPMVALMLWTMVMWVWMYATRLPAMSRSKVDPDDAVRDPDKTLDRTLPAQVQWKAHNYNHLHEQPTLFYAVGFVLVLLGIGDGMTALLGWMYTGTRIIHSLVQAIFNRVAIRFALFLFASVVLTALIVDAALEVY